MIRFLSIRNLAVVEALEVEFGEGLNVLTGETGAGKSIVTGAIGLLLGARASGDLVRTGETLATVQAVFDRPDGDEMVVRREISAEGRSRAFVDEALVSVAGLRDLGRGLVDLHGQHEHQALLDTRTHLDLLDGFGRLDASRAAVAAAFETYRRVRDERSALLEQARTRSERTEFLRFQLAEIDRVAPRPGEDDELAAELKVLSNAERLREACLAGYEALYEGDGSVLGTLAGIWRRLQSLRDVDPAMAELVAVREAVTPPLEELAFSLRGYLSKIEASPEHLQRLSDRLAALERLKRRFQGSLADVLSRADDLRRELAGLEGFEDRQAQAEASFAAAREQYAALARQLSAERGVRARRLAAALQKALAELAMPAARCDVRLVESLVDEARWSGRGCDEAEVWISPNPGEELRPLVRIASGGELSRVMLALKTLVTTDAPGKTLVFDEVDAGIGGQVADVVGQRLRALGDAFQVLCVTHLPQIAAYGHRHYRIEKRVRGSRTVTEVTPLDARGRADEIGRMIGGATVSDRVLASAEEMLERRSVGEEKTKGESERAKAKGKRVG